MRRGQRGTRLRTQGAQIRRQIVAWRCQRLQFLLNQWAGKLLYGAQSPPVADEGPLDGNHGACTGIESRLQDATAALRPLRT